MEGTPRPWTVSTKQQRIAELAKQMPGVGLTSLSHHIDRWMREAYRRTRKDGAPGIDGQTAKEYEENLEENLQSLLNRAKEGDTYRAPAVRRVYIPKGDGSEKRPIGIPTFEDKVLQRATLMALEPVYEQDFLVVRTAVGLVARHTKPSGSCTPSSVAGEGDGSLKSTYESILTRWTTRNFGRSFANGYVMVCCCDSSASG